MFPMGVNMVSTIVTFLFVFFYKITVQLAVEMTKYILMLVMFCTTMGLGGFLVLSVVLWAYVTYDSSIWASLGALCVGALVLGVSIVAVDILAQRIFQLAESPLSQFVRVYTRSITKTKQPLETKLDS